MDHFLYAINVQDGSKIWSVDLGGPALATPLLAQGHPLCGHAGNQMIAVDTANGNVQWKYDTKGPVWSAPVLKIMIYFGDLSNNIYAVTSKEGTLPGRDAVGPISGGFRGCLPGLVFVCETGEVLRGRFQE